MRNDALVSVIVPIYMVQDYLEKCINSIIEQTYSNLEIILVDDGSKDDCGKVCDAYAQKDKRIKVIHKENGGLSDARNEGIEMASGKYIVFVDSDDFIHPRMVEFLAEPVIYGKADMSVCEYVVVKDNEDILPVDNIKGKNTIFIESYLDKKQYFLCETYVKFTVAWNKFYPKEYFDNIRYPKGKIHEDEFTTYKLLEKADRIAYLKEPLYYYVQRENSIMGEGFNEKSLDRYEALNERINYYIKQGNYDWAEKIHSILRMMFINDARKINACDEYDYHILKESLRCYRKTTIEHVFKYPISFKHKFGYLFMALFPKIYLEKRI